MVPLRVEKVKDLQAVIPAKAGIQKKDIRTTGCRIRSGMTRLKKIMDSRLRGNDKEKEV
jgi:hypothetical protein